MDYLFIFLWNNNIFFFWIYIYQHVFRTNVINKEKLMKLQRTLFDKLTALFSWMVTGNRKRSWENVFICQKLLLVSVPIPIGICMYKLYFCSMFTVHCTHIFNYKISGVTRDLMESILPLMCRMVYETLFQKLKYAFIVPHSPY